MTFIKTVKSDSRCELTERRSKFIGYCFAIKTEADAENILSSLKKEHPFATHICYAYSTNFGTSARFSDDGEPKGTAGQPIAEVIKKNGITNVLLAVVRYFGGIKLGAGGLVRAYSATATETLKSAGITELRLLQIFEVRLDFASAAKIKSLIFATELSRDYSNLITIRLATDNPSGLSDELSGILRQTISLLPVGTEWIQI